MAIRVTLSLQTLAAIVLAIGLTVGGTALIRANAKPAIAEERIPLPVATTQYQLQSQYQRASNYVGTIRAVTESAMGFEVGGQLASMPAREGMRVAAGEPLASLDTERRKAQRERAQAQLNQVKSDLALAEKRRTRTAELVTRGLASQQSLDEVELGAEALQSARAAAEAGLLDAELQLQKSTLRAPYDGIVAERLVQPGATVAAGTPVVRLIAETRREAHVGIPVRIASALTPGQDYALQVGERVMTGTLRSLRDDLDERTLTLAAIFSLPDQRPPAVGETVQLTLVRNVEADGGWLPISALIEGQRGLWTVLRVRRDNGEVTTARESVEVVAVSGDRAYVRGTLLDKAEVVATGLQRISPGAVIAPISNTTATTAVGGR